MTQDDIALLSLSLPGAARVTLWGRQDVYKVGGKVFAICETDNLSFKATEIAYAVLIEAGRGRRAPGFVPGRWANVPLEGLEPDEAAGWIATSHGLATAGLTRAARAELGL